jgi:hypothetical protein
MDWTAQEFKSWRQMILALDLNCQVAPTNRLIERELARAWTHRNGLRNERAITELYLSISGNPSAREDYLCGISTGNRERPIAPLPGLEDTNNTREVRRD